MTKIVSFDVGIKNMAYCILDKDTKAIEDWNVVQLTENIKDLDSISDSLINLLDEILDNTDSHELCVLIENQPAMKNPTMKSVQMVLYTYFILMRKKLGLQVSVDFVSASRKLKYMVQNYPDMNRTEKSYKANKANAVAYCKYYLHSKEDEKNLDFFQRHKKKDDLSDALIQALSFF